MKPVRNAPTVPVIPGYTQVVKTAISVPDETFDRVCRRAVALGMSRSEFFARAAQRYLDELDAESLTDQIDTALESIDSPDESQQAAVAVGRRVAGTIDDDW
jgi:metal-responsive CopG/Arc/MetJ family transcriptional regulator